VIERYITDITDITDITGTPTSAVAALGVTSLTDKRAKDQEASSPQAEAWTERSPIARAGETRTHDPTRELRQRAAAGTGSARPIL